MRAQYGPGGLPPRRGGPQLPSLSTVLIFSLLIAFPGFFFGLFNKIIIAVLVLPPVKKNRVSPFRMLFVFKC